MNAVDTSVLVAAFATWHESHERAALALAQGARLIAHVAVETFAVLTRLPPPHRAPARLVVDFLESNFTGPPVALAVAEYPALLQLVSTSGLRGGSVYDALVAATARQEGLDLLTVDQRALPTYERVGAHARLLT